MKKLSVLWIGLALSALLTGCAGSSVGEPSPYAAVNDLAGVEMTVKEGSAGPAGLTLVMENKTAREHSYGAFYAVERLRDGAWVTLPRVTKEEATWIALAYILTPGQRRELEPVNWEWLYGKLPPGQYRIVKIVDNRNLAAEFTVS